MTNILGFHPHTFWNHLMCSQQRPQSDPRPFLWSTKHFGDSTKGQSGALPSPSPPGPPSQGHISHTPSFELHDQCTSTLSSMDPGLARLRTVPSVGDCSPVWSVKWRFMMTPVPRDSELQLLGESWLGQCWSPPLAPGRVASRHPWSLGSWLYSVTSSVTLVCSVTHGKDRDPARMPREAPHQDLIPCRDLSCFVYCQGLKHKAQTHTHINTCTHK